MAGGYEYAFATLFVEVNSANYIEKICWFFVWLQNKVF